MWQFKSEEGIKNKVKEVIEQSINGLEKESPKLDFKSKWYDLTSEEEIFEFIKDTNALVNTVGLDALIIFGFDERRKIFQDAVCSDSNKSSHEINDVLKKRISHFFDFSIYDFDDIEIDGTTRKLSILHIPTFLDKPVVIKGYKNFRQLDSAGNPRIEEQKIFVRKNSSNRPATKYDLDLMYYDRKNIIPDYRVEIHLIDLKEFFRNGITHLVFSLFIENLGIRSICMKRISIGCEFEEKDGSIFQMNEIAAKIQRLDMPHLVQKQIELSNFVLTPNQANSVYFNISTVMSTNVKKSLIQNWNKHGTSWIFNLELVNGKTLPYKLDF